MALSTFCWSNKAIFTTWRYRFLFVTISPFSWWYFIEQFQTSVGQIMVRGGNCSFHLGLTPSGAFSVISQSGPDAVKSWWLSHKRLEKIVTLAFLVTLMTYHSSSMWRLWYNFFLFRIVNFIKYRKILLQLQIIMFVKTRRRIYFFSIHSNALVVRLIWDNAPFSSSPMFFSSGWDCLFTTIPVVVLKLLQSFTTTWARELRY